MFELFTNESIDAVLQGVEEAKSLGDVSVKNHHILLGLLKFLKKRAKYTLKTVLDLTGITYPSCSKKIKKNFIKNQEQVFISHETILLFYCACKISRKKLQPAVTIEFLFLAICHLDFINTVAYKLILELLQKFNSKANISSLVQIITDAYMEKKGKKLKKFVGLYTADVKILEKYTTNLSEKAECKSFTPIIGRNEEVKRIINILMRLKKNNPLLIGEPGVGKTAIIENLTFVIQNFQGIPEKLKNLKFLELDLALLLSGTQHRGAFESRFKELLDILKNYETLVLVIDEIHTIMGAGVTQDGGQDAAGILLPSLASGELKCIGATTIAEYRQLFQKDIEFDRFFQPVTVPEPTKEQAIPILEGLRLIYEKYHGIKINSEALITAVNLSSQFIIDRFLPDKALDLIDEGCARVKLQKIQDFYIRDPLKDSFEKIELEKEWAIQSNDFKKADQYAHLAMELKVLISTFIPSFTAKSRYILNSDVITDVVSEWTGIPMPKVLISVDETTKLANMENTLGEKVIGQKRAISAIAKAVRRARTGLKNPNRPIASFIFVGPTGVGKTELAKALSSFIFHSEDSLIRLDMSEYSQAHTVAKLIGAPPGYVGYSEGGFLTEQVKSKPYSIILMDEIEKGHQDIYNLLLQILDDGRLTDSMGRTIDFKNTFLILTSNIGSECIQNTENTQALLEFKSNSNEISVEDTQLSENVLGELKKFFKPEFLNRLDDIIIFHSLTLAEINKISEILLDQLINRILKSINCTIEIDKSSREKLATLGFDPFYGARPLRRAIIKYIENPLSDFILKKTPIKGTHLKLNLDDENKLNIISILPLEFSTSMIEKNFKDKIA